MINKLKCFSVPADISGPKTNAEHPCEFIVNCLNYILSNKEKIIEGKKLLSISYWVFNCQNLGVHFPIVILPIKNTGNSPLSPEKDKEERMEEKKKKREKKKGMGRKYLPMKQLAKD